MQSLEVSGAIRRIYGSLGVKRLIVPFRLCLNDSSTVFEHFHIQRDGTTGLL